MGRQKTKEARAVQKSQKPKKISSLPLDPKKLIKIKLRFTKIKQTIIKEGSEPVINMKEVQSSKSQVLSAMRKTQPVTSEYLYKLNKKGFAERVLFDGSTERIELVEEIREIELGKGESSADVSTSPKQD